MHGPPLTPVEVAAVVSGAVARLERLGIDHNQAVQAVAIDNGCSTDAVAAAIERDRRGFAADRLDPVGHV